MNIDKKVLEVTKNLEKQVDSVIEQIDNLDAKDIEQLRKNRLKELKDLEAKKQEWATNGHGKYEELAEEKMFFDVIKKSDNVVIHFYTNTNMRSKIVDMHLKVLAPKHFETRFVTIDAERCPFLAERLKVKVIPTLICINNCLMVDKIIGFTTLGNCDDFSTEMLEWRLAQNKVIEYDGDLSVPPGQQSDKKTKIINKRSIRDGSYSDSDEDLELGDYSVGMENLHLDVIKNGGLTPEERKELELSDDDEDEKEK